MIRSELFKIQHHRTPATLAGLFGLLILAAPVYLAFRPPVSTDIYLVSFTEVFALAGSLIAAIFGAWVVGHEYRQGTLRRVVGIDARRARLLSVKAGVGLVALVGATIVIAALGVGASAGAAAIHGDGLIYDGLVRDIAGGVFTITIVGAVGFILSVVLRSDTYAMLGALALMVVLGPLLELVPTVGPYLPSAVTAQISSGISGAELVSEISLATAATTLTATLAAAAVAGVALFQRRDI